MKLQYKVLWLEDQPQNVDGIKQRLESLLKKQGFLLEVCWATTNTDIKDRIEKLRNYHDFDLILVDYHLGGPENGDKMAKLIRRFTKTEIVFYSATPAEELRRKIFDQGIDGVYSVNRQDLAVEAMAVIETTIKKVLDLNHMRGIMMSTVSDFDHSIADCLAAHHDGLDEASRAALLDKMRDKMRKKADETLAKLERLTTLDTILSDHDFTTMNRYHVLQSCLKSLKHEAVGPLREKLKDYERVVKLRNDLAHGRLVEQDGVFRLDGKTVEVDEKTFRDARVSLLEHQQNFERILELLNSLCPPTDSTEV